MRLLFTFLALLLTGCADLAPQARRQHADQLADQAGWQKLRVPTETFILTAYAPGHITHADTLTVYIEGDGLAWLSRSQASNDPTPRNPVGLQLALRHPQGTAVYLARPCQYVEPDDARNCRQAYWTGGRFAPEVIEASDQAISELKRRFGSSRLVLVGYSGGGAVAALLAAQRKDVARLVTVAGNLDHRAWTRKHRVAALEGSLNPADQWRSLVDVPQRHFVGGRDEVVGREVTDAYLSRFPSHRRPEVVVIPDFDHACCWAGEWGSVWLKGRD